MIIFGVILAMAAGTGLPIHIFLFGRVINQFVYYDIALGIPIQNALMRLSMSCDDLVTDIENGDVNSSVITIADKYFCDAEQSDVFKNILDFVCDPDDTFIDRISLFALYYVGLASGVLIAIFFSTMFWNLSAYKQTRRIRERFYHSILHQDIGWFDVTPAAQLSTRLAELV